MCGQLELGQCVDIERCVSEWTVTAVSVSECSVSVYTVSAVSVWTVRAVSVWGQLEFCQCGDS